MSQPVEIVADPLEPSPAPPGSSRARRSAAGLRRASAGLWRDWFTRIGVIGLLVFIGLALLGPVLTTRQPFETVRLADGGVAANMSPSWSFPAGTNRLGQDLFVQLVHGARMAFVVGLSAALSAALLGTLVGMLAGYFGRSTDQILMRLTDMALAIPALPFALVFLALFGPGLQNIIVVLSLLLWRTTARVVRAQVLTLKERPYVMAARAAGAGHGRLMFVHILPNVMPVVLLYVALGIGGAVAAEASISFLGFGDPLTPTWGQMLNMAFQSGALRSAWWWVVYPGVALTIFVTSVYMISRGYEETVNPRLREH